MRINCNGFYLLYQTNGHMHMKMIISSSAVKIINRRNLIAMYWFKSKLQTMAISYLDFFAFFGYSFPIQLPLNCYQACRMLNCFISFIMYHLSHELWDMQHLTNRLTIFSTTYNLIVQLLLCANIAVNKCLTTNTIKHVST